MKWLLSYWPPFLFSGIRVVAMDNNFRYAKVELRMYFWNKNAVASHFGGSLFAMTDPMYMLMIKANLSADYVVWDKFADIDFIKPGYGKLSAEFVLNETLLSEIQTATAGGKKFLPCLPVTITDQQGNVVAKVNRTVYIRKKLQ